MSGEKFDQQKIDPTYLVEYFPRALLEVARVAMHGAEKYERGGWKYVENGEQRYEAALLRHIIMPHIEGEYDKDSGLLHKAHRAWNALATLELHLKEEDIAHPEDKVSAD